MFSQSQSIKTNQINFIRTVYPPQPNPYAYHIRFNQLINIHFTQTLNDRLTKNQVLTRVTPATHADSQQQFNTVPEHGVDLQSRA